MRRSSSRVSKLPGVTSTLRPFPIIPEFIDSALVAPRGGLHGGAAVRQMADDFRMAAEAGRGITDIELRAKGWSAAQINSHCADAVQLADAMRGLA